VIRVIHTSKIFDQVEELLFSIRNFLELAVSLEIIVILNIDGPTVQIFNEGNRTGCNNDI
jgi:hypothetical protein